MNEETNLKTSMLLQILIVTKLEAQNLWEPSRATGKLYKWLCEMYEIFEEEFGRKQKNV